MSSSPRRPMRFSDHPHDPTPTIVRSEWSRDELAERYVSQCRARMMDRRQAAAQGKGDGDQAAVPTRRPDDDDNQALRRRSPGSR